MIPKGLEDSVTRFEPLRLAMGIALCAAWADAMAAPAGTAPGCVAPSWSEAGLRRVTHLPHGQVAGPPAAFPLRATGDIRLLVILAEFSDIPHRADPQRFLDRLFGPGVSLREYYLEASQDLLDVTGDVHGWVTLPRSQFSYSQGEGGIGSYPNNGQGMAEEAVAAAVSQGLDLDAYDADGDGVVDALLVIHSGQGREWAASSPPSPSPDPESVHSHKWIVVQQDFGFTTRVVDYFTGPELQLVTPGIAPGWADSVQTVGVYCHEFGHVLGLPDFYDTVEFTNHVGVWDLMDFGTWNRVKSDSNLAAPGALPSHFSAWSKLFLGWNVAAPVAPAVGEVARQTVTLESASAGGFPVQLLANPFGVDWASRSPGAGEYFLGEVRTRTGFDAGLPSEGLLLYHVDESRTSNNAAANQDGGGLLRLLAQDGSTVVKLVGPPDTTDHWPGAQTAFGPSSTPGSALWSGSPSGVSVPSIGLLLGGTVTLDVEVTNLSTGTALPFARPNPFRPSAHGTTGLVASLEGLGGTPSIGLYDLRGRLVRRLAGSDFDAARRVAYWDGMTDGGSPAPAGIYFFRTDGSAASGKVALVR
jgi:immune inhibitor A